MIPMAYVYLQRGIGYSEQNPQERKESVGKDEHGTWFTV